MLPGGSCVSPRYVRRRFCNSSFLPCFFKPNNSRHCDNSFTRKPATYSRKRAVIVWPGCYAYSKDDLDLQWSDITWYKVSVVVQAVAISHAANDGRNRPAGREAIFGCVRDNCRRCHANATATASSQTVCMLMLGVEGTLYQHDLAQNCSWQGNDDKNAAGDEGATVERAGHQTLWCSLRTA